jgi:hypothetical protein
MAPRLPPLPGLIAFLSCIPGVALRATPGYPANGAGGAVKNHAIRQHSQAFNSSFLTGAFNCTPPGGVQTQALLRSILSRSNRRCPLSSISFARINGGLMEQAGRLHKVSHSPKSATAASKSLIMHALLRYKLHAMSLLESLKRAFVRANPRLPRLGAISAEAAPGDR